MYATEMKKLKFRETILLKNLNFINCQKYQNRIGTELKLMRTCNQLAIKCAQMKDSGKFTYKNISCACMLSLVTLCNPVNSSQPGSSSIGFSRQEFQSGLPFPPPGNLPDPRVELTSLMSPSQAGRVFTSEPPGKPSKCLLAFTK